MRHGMNSGVALVHCSYHKCLTAYYASIMHILCNRLLLPGGRYAHYNSMVDEFYRCHRRFRIASLNNHCLDLDRLGAFRMTRFIRDPRDLVVSGYFYWIFYSCDFELV